ncbi:MAG TPA: nuclear transport factor 2 family protein [Rhizomicrobium sp.]|nr:nuclear transport factor 2 family protein [Rhizomicrobium sp.]
MNDDTTNKDLMLAVMAGFKSGKLETLFAAIRADVSWKVMAPRAFFRFGGTYQGVAGVKEFTALLFSDYHLVRLNPRTVTAKGDEVWGMFDAEALHRSSGRYAQFELSLHWRMKDGQIAEQLCFFDTASVLIQQGDLTTEAA